MNEPTGDWAQTVAHLLALAERMEGHGQNNIGMLLRAGADSLVRRSGYRVDLPGDKEALASDLGHLLAMLPGFGLSEALGAAMQRGEAAMRDGHLPLYEDIPHPYVCRTCGELLMAAPDTPCPTCGAWPSTFLRFKPIYWLDELHPLEALEQLASTPGLVAGFLDGLSEEQLARPAADGGWSMRQVVSHLRDAEGVMNYRVKLMAEQDNATLESLPVFDWAASDENRPPTTAEIFADYRQSREQSLVVLHALAPWDWYRAGLHTEFGPVTILNQASYFSAHEQTHLAALASLRDAALS
jgi:hypothetical protein